MCCKQHETCYISQMNVFKEFRKRHSLSQAELGDLLNIGQSAISNYENSEREPEVHIAKQFVCIAKAKGDAYTLDDVYRADQTAA